MFAVISFILSFILSMPFVLLVVAYLLPNILEIICLLYLDKLLEKKLFFIKLLIIPVITVVTSQLILYYEIDSY